MAWQNDYIYSEMALWRFIFSAFKDHRKEISTINKIYKIVAMGERTHQGGSTFSQFQCFHTGNILSSSKLACCCAIVNLRLVHSKNLLS